MSGGNQSYYLPTFGNDANRHSLQYDASSQTGLAPSGHTNDGMAFGSNNQQGAYQAVNPAGSLPIYQGASMPNRHGGVQGHPNIAMEFTDTFNTPSSNPTVHMKGGSPSTQNFPSIQYGSFTQSPTSMHDQNGHMDALQGVPESGGMVRGHSLAESHNAEDGMGQPPSKKKKKGKNGEAVVSGSGSGAEDKEKEKEKDNRRKT